MTGCCDCRPPGFVDRAFWFFLFATNYLLTELL